MITTRKLTISAMVVALYIVVLYLTQSVSFGAYQIRIATSLYALAYAFPFLVIPMGIGNLISNFLFGGLGILDMMGGFGVGILTTGIIVGMRKIGLSALVGRYCRLSLYLHCACRYGLARCLAFHTGH